MLKSSHKTIFAIFVVATVITISQSAFAQTFTESYIPINHQSIPQNQDLVSISNGPGTNHQITILLDSSRKVFCEINDCFNPSFLKINPGDTVTWINNDITLHRVTSGISTSTLSGGLFDEDIPLGFNPSITFDNDGIFSYYCNLHPWLTGLVMVGIGSDNTDLQTKNNTIPTNPASETGSTGTIPTDPNAQEFSSEDIITYDSTITLSPNLASETGSTVTIPTDPNTPEFSSGDLITSDSTTTLPTLISSSEFREEMRVLWQDHTVWTRIFIISTVAGLDDINATTDRLMQNQDDIGNAIKPYYGNDAGNELSVLLKTHISTAADLVNASNDGNTVAASTAERNWYDNADQMAVFLGNMNSSWSEQSIKQMFDEHLVLTKQQVVARISGNWTGDIMAFDAVQKQALMMADDLSNGIIAQFPEKFEPMN